jgi:hypothetical protein
LVVEDALHQSQQEQGYCLELRNEAAFRVSLKNDKNTRQQYHVPRGAGAFAVPITCVRYGYDGPIGLTIVGPGGLRLLTRQIDAKVNEATLLLAAEANAQAGDLSAFKLLAHTPDFALTTVVEGLDLIRTQAPQFAAPPDWMNGRVWVGIVDAVEPFFSIAPAATEITYADGKAETTLKLERKNGEFKTAVNVVIEDLPGYLQASTKLENDQITLTISGPPQLAGGRHVLNVQTFGEFQGKGIVLPVQLTLVIP